MGFVDDVNLEEKISPIASDVQTIIDSHPSTGLLPNTHNFQITANNLDIVDNFMVFENFRRVAKKYLTLLGEGRAVDKALYKNTATLEMSIKRLSTLQDHDAFRLLNNSLAMPKLLYILRTSACAGSPILDEFDLVLKAVLKKTSSMFNNPTAN